MISMLDVSMLFYNNTSLSNHWNGYVELEFNDKIIAYTILSQSIFFNDIYYYRTFILLYVYSVYCQQQIVYVILW